MTIVDIKGTSRVEIGCNKCGYKKSITINPDNDGSKEFLEHQVKKNCPNCGSEKSLIVNKIL